MGIQSFNLEQIRVNTVIVGTGSACTLESLGQDDVLLISENRLCREVTTMAGSLESDSKPGIPFRDMLQVIKVLSDGKSFYGLLCLDNSDTYDRPHYVAIRARNVIYATGSELNAGQVGFTRCSQYIAAGQSKDTDSTERYNELLSEAVKEMNRIAYGTKAEAPCTECR